MGPRLRTSCLAGLVIILAAGPGAQGAPPVTVQVYAAASLTDAFGDLCREVEAVHPDLRLRLTVAGSQEIAQQIRQGAPADVVALADERAMAAVTAARPGTAPRLLARNRLAVVVAASARTRITSLADLATPGLRLVLADAAVPAGSYTRQMLARASLKSAYGSRFPGRVRRNVVSYETNVRQVRAKVALDEADAGIVYESDTRGPGAEHLTVVAVPAAVNIEAHYVIAVPAGAPQAAAGQLVMAHALSAAGQRRMRQAGFLPAGGASGWR